MQALLRAYANAWSQAGAAKLAYAGECAGRIGKSVVAGRQGARSSQAGFRPNGSQAGTGSLRLRRELVRIGSRLPWMQGNMKMPESFQGRFAYVELAGPRGKIADTDISFGLYLQQRAVIYPSHWHAAVEDYLVVSGTAMWQVDDGRFRGPDTGHPYRACIKSTTRDDNAA